MVSCYSIFVFAAAAAGSERLKDFGQTRNIPTDLALNCFPTIFQTVSSLCKQSLPISAELILVRLKMLKIVDFKCH